MAAPDQTEDLLTPDLQPKVVHAGDDWNGQPFVLVTADAIALVGAPDKGVIVDSRFGTTLQGDIHFSESPENISFGGGYWRLNPMVSACIGSSAALPIPMLVEGKPDALASKKDIAGILGSLDMGTL